MGEGCIFSVLYRLTSFILSRLRLPYFFGGGGPREVSPPVAHLLTLYSQSKQSDLQQRCLEFLQLAREGPAAMAAVLPVDASCEDVEVRNEWPWLAVIDDLSCADLLFYLFIFKCFRSLIISNANVLFLFFIS